MRELLIINIEVVFVCKYLNFAKPTPAIQNNAYYLNSKILSNHKMTIACQIALKSLILGMKQRKCLNKVTNEECY
jgi:hypothetical protein